MSHIRACTRCPIGIETARSGCVTCGIYIIRQQTLRANARKHTWAVVAVFLVATIAGIAEGILAKHFLDPMLMMGVMWYASAAVILLTFIILTKRYRGMGPAYSVSDR